MCALYLVVPRLGLTLLPVIPTEFERSENERRNPGKNSATVKSDRFQLC